MGPVENFHMKQKDNPPPFFFDRKVANENILVTFIIRSDRLPSDKDGDPLYLLTL